MKTKLIFISLCILLKTGNAQVSTQSSLPTPYTVEQTVFLEKKIDSIEIVALYTMIEFVLNQDTQLFNHARLCFKTDTALLNDLFANGRWESGIDGGVEGTIIDMHKHMISAEMLLYDVYSFKQNIMKEKPEDRKKKVFWLEKDFLLSNYSKQQYIDLNNRLNQLAH